MKILNKEVSFDIEEAENLDKVVELDIKYQEKLKDATTMLEQCKVYKDFFDELIGAGTSDMLFGEKNRISELIDAYMEIFNATEKFANDINEKRKLIDSKIERYKR